MAVKYLKAADVGLKIGDAIYLMGTTAHYIVLGIDEKEILLNGDRKLPIDRLKDILVRKDIKGEDMDVEGKVFADMQTEYLIMYIKGELTFGARVKGIMTTADKQFAVFSKDTREEDVKIDTMFYYDKEANGVIQDPDADWFVNASDVSVTLPTLPKNVMNQVYVDMKKTAGVYAEGHSSTRLTDATQTMDAIVDMCHNIEAKYAELKSALETFKKDLMGIGIEGFIHRYAFKEHILITGPSGSSKTYSVDKYITDNKYEREFIAGHEAIEAIDLLGYSIRHTDGSFVWLDGPLTSAFRKAKVGKSVLFLDELLRIPTKELNILIGALTPNSSNEYVLRTNRLIGLENGIGTSETITVPKDNLWVIGTTNMGSNYDVNEMDLALNDRFMITDVVIQQEVVDNIITISDVNALGEVVRNRLSKLFELVNKLVQAKELSYPLNIRHITKVLRLADKKEEVGVYLKDLAPQVVSRTTEGVLNTTELQIYHDTVNAMFSSGG